jgi:hypothetical protein
MHLTPNAPDWKPWLDVTTGAAKQADIARRSGIHQTTVNRWVTTNRQPPAWLAVKVARAYDASPVEALAAAGYIRQDETGAPEDPTPSLARFPLSTLLEEIAQRGHADDTEIVV